MIHPTPAGGLVEVAEDMAVEMRDGIVLRADVYRPPGGEPAPALVCRTAYGKRGEAFGADYVGTARGLVARGYLVVIQDVRGRYASEGEYRWLYRPDCGPIHDRDGYDTAEWAAGLDGCDGRVGTFGNSYDAFTSMRTAGAAPPALAAAFASGVAARMQDESRGIFESIYLAWINGMAPDVRARTSDTTGPQTREAAEREWEEHGERWLWSLPYDALPRELFGEMTDWLKEFLRDQESDPWALPETHPNVAAPVCHVTGWWDFVVRGAIADFASLRASGDPQLRDRHRLVIGPWSHEPGGMAPGVGAVRYEPTERVPYHDLIADWYDFTLRGDDAVGFGEAPVRAFVLNENRWRHFEDWPPPQALRIELLLGGDGRLTPGSPAVNASRGFRYDPADPVPSTSDWSTRAVDQSVLDGRTDVLVYATDPIEDELLLAGEVECVLWAATDAVETDFTAKLVEVRPDGLAIALSTGILRTRFLDGYDRVRQLEPGVPVELTIAMGPAGVRLARGSRIRLDISSSDFPNFDRNHNTGRDYWADDELRPAQQTVFNDAAHPSRLVVHALPLEEEKT